jgi:hypothetical protein
MAHLHDLRHLTNLSIASDRITGAGLAPPEGFGPMNKLWIGGNGITDDGVAHLKGIKDCISDLRISSDRITDEGLAPLEGMLIFPPAENIHKKVRK